MGAVSDRTVVIGMFGRGQSIKRETGLVPIMAIAYLRFARPRLLSRGPLSGYNPLIQAAIPSGRLRITGRTLMANTQQSELSSATRGSRSQ